MKTKGMPRKQRGIVAVVVAIGLLALVAMVGFAFDSGHLMLNKSRLQNTVDAAALTAAKVLDLTGSEAQAEASARASFDTNASGHRELDQVMSGADIAVHFSNTLEPWAPGSAPANYVRVVADDFTMWNSFTSLVGFSNASTAASAVAGPSAPVGSEEGNEACDLVPMMVCADMSPGAPGDWGYTGDNVTLLKFASSGSPNMGPGNYQLIRLGGPGASIVRTNLAGGYDQCLDPSGNVETQPGNDVGPVSQGLNTRFGQYQGGGMNASTYPPDKVTTEPNPDLDVANDEVTVIFKNGPPVGSINEVSFTYDDYKARLASGPFDFANGKPQRRVVAVPFVNCSGPHEGQSTLPVVGLGCFFLLQPAVHKGNDNYVYAEYIGDCGADGSPGPAPNPNPVSGTGIYKIVLHNDPLSPDS
jgi:Flp pilus assembly protein TadG